MNTEAILRAYIECALWAETDNADASGGEPLGANYTLADIAPSAYEDMRQDVERFIEAAAPTIDSMPPGTWTDAGLGHDLWLTRNGHGTGFWDRPKACGLRLTEIADVLGPCDLYVGYDGKLYVS